VNEIAQDRLRVFKNKPYSRFARKHGISDTELCKSAASADRGLVAADLGGGVIKQRIARPGSGKSGGFRALIVFRIRTLAVFIHGFAKNETDNIGPVELVALKKLAAELASYRELELQKAVSNGTLMEVHCDGTVETLP
jgi:hypothetical protein